MFNLSIAELSEIIEGSISFGTMPPLAGLLEPIGRIVVDVREVRERDVLWTFGEQASQACYQADDAYSRGAMGIVVAGRRIEPWAGKFSVVVADAIGSLHRLMRCLRAADGSWPTTVFGQDDVMQEIMRTVWQRDSEATQSAIERIALRVASAA